VKGGYGGMSSPFVGAKQSRGADFTPCRCGFVVASARQELLTSITAVNTAHLLRYFSTPFIQPIYQIIKPLT
jgi:hypothetical protein